uniref:Uncharacterized protein n=1 Tax=Helianthus annuus TaxID=4232 RepID=A0A251S114_HELAN
MSLHSGNLMNCTIEKGSMVDIRFEVVVFQGLLVVRQGTHKNSELKHSPTQRTRLESPTFRRKFRILHHIWTKGVIGLTHELNKS